MSNHTIVIPTPDLAAATAFYRIAWGTDPHTETAYYVRFDVTDRPGVIAEVASELRPDRESSSPASAGDRPWSTKSVGAHATKDPTTWSSPSRGRRTAPPKRSAAMPSTGWSISSAVPPKP